MEAVVVVCLGREGGVRRGVGRVAAAAAARAASGARRPLSLSLWTGRRALGPQLGGGSSSAPRCPGGARGARTRGRFLREEERERASSPFFSYVADLSRPRTRATRTHARAPLSPRAQLLPPTKGAPFEKAHRCRHRTGCARGQQHGGVRLVRDGAPPSRFFRPLFAAVRVCGGVRVLLFWVGAGESMQVV